MKSPPKSAFNPIVRKRPILLRQLLAPYPPVKSTILALLALSVAFTLRAEVPAKSCFIREEGSYQLTEKSILKLYADSSGILHSRYETKLSPESEGSHDGSLEVARGGPFVLYWDSPSRTLWGASAKKLFNFTDERQTTYGGLALADLKTTPEEFQQEVQRLFRPVP